MSGAPISQRDLVTLETRERLRVADSKVVSTRESHARTARVTDRPTPGDMLFVVRSSDRVSILRVGDVQWIESAGNYVAVHTSGGRLLTRQTMAHIASRLPPDLFVRIHRGAIVNVQGLVEIRRWRRGLLIVTLRSGARLRVSRTYRGGLDKAVARIGVPDVTHEVQASVSP
ncbi:MAG TPA: LytTR family DNA-binding domain-containing protein [Gemmatimonadaceae bacterium]|nr:LytTR family DNA-binding domain-containing protein [Gemmatimonadaceae bacterium]